MAGIGYELRKILKRDSLLALLQAYTYAAVISSGPWMLSMVGMIAIGLMNVAASSPLLFVSQFQVSVTYVIVVSLCLTGLTQLAFTRYVSDRLFENNTAIIMPSFHGIVLWVTLGIGGVGFAAIFLLFPEQSLLYKLLLLALLVIMSNIWMAAIFLSGLRQYRSIVFLFAVGYGISVASAWILRPLELEGLMLGFTLGQLVLLVGMITLILRNFPAQRFIGFDFANRKRFYVTLVLSGFFFNAAMWVDKVAFWHHPLTGQDVIGPLRASIIHDVPVFLAYLSMIPGFAIFLMRMETDFVDYYSRFFDAVRNGGSLEMLERLRNDMTGSVRVGIYDIVKVQALTACIVAAGAPWILELFGLSAVYEPILRVCLIAAGAQTVLLSLMNVLLYLDRRRPVAAMTIGLFVLNLILTYVSLELGPEFYGMGYAAALLVVCMAGFFILDRKLERIEYEVFMLQ